jgi:hypothetical protein
VVENRLPLSMSGVILVSFVIGRSWPNPFYSTEIDHSIPESASQILQRTSRLHLSSRLFLFMYGVADKASYSNFYEFFLRNASLEHRIAKPWGGRLFPFFTELAIALPTYIHFLYFPLTTFLWD